MEWNASPEMMGEIRASIKPVRSDMSLCQVLAEDFPRDCSHLPISGGWGYTEGEAIKFVRDRFPVPAAADFVPMEYHIAHKIIYEELIVFRPKDHGFSGISMNLALQSLIEQDGRHFDLLEFSVGCWADRHWNQLKNEWESNDFGTRAGFDAEAHAAKREASHIKYSRKLWFDISEVFGRGA
jgi:hypothetical protein